jgi:short-subunit dehydrogenase
MKGTVMILGASSAIARGTAAAMAKQGYSLYLAGRDEQELQRDASDLQLRFGVNVGFGLFDAEQYGQHPAFLEQVIAEMGALAGVVVAFGYLGEQEKAALDFDETLAIINRNYVGAVSILNLCAQRMEGDGRGFIVGITSVAGDRGRQSNYTYGSAKGAFSLYLQGLRNRLASSGVQVVTVKPGFVDTGMTFGLEGMFLVASPRYVGEQIARAVEKGKDIIYLPWFWRYIMLIITHIPERIFKRLSL